MERLEPQSPWPKAPFERATARPARAEGHRGSADRLDRARAEEQVGGAGGDEPYTSSRESSFSAGDSHADPPTDARALASASDGCTPITRGSRSDRFRLELSPHAGSQWAEKGSGVRWPREQPLSRQSSTGPAMQLPSQKAHRSRSGGPPSPRPEGSEGCRQTALARRVAPGSQEQQPRSTNAGGQHDRRGRGPRRGPSRPSTGRQPQGEQRSRQALAYPARTARTRRTPAAAAAAAPRRGRAPCCRRSGQHGREDFRSTRRRPAFEKDRPVRNAEGSAPSRQTRSSGPRSRDRRGGATAGRASTASNSRSRSAGHGMPKIVRAQRASTSRGAEAGPSV